MKRFSDLYSAGRELATALHEYSGSKQTLVIGIAIGGIPVALEVAKRLQLRFELLVIRRLLAPHGPEKPICAVSIAGNLVVDDELGPRPATPTSGLDHSIADGLEELSRCERACRGNEPPRKLGGTSVILVDNGIHSGSTMLTAIRALRKAEITSIVVAVPVADPGSRGAVELAADRLVCLGWPEKFGHVGLWYQNFNRPNEDTIRKSYLEMTNE